MRIFFEILLLLWLSGVVYSYIGYPLLLAVLPVFFKKTVRFGNVFPTVTVIIPAYNEERVIKAKIENVLSLEYPPEKLTVLVGSDQSSDRTGEIVRSFKYPRVKLWVAEKRGGKTPVINYLALHAESEVVLLTDANTMHKPSSLALLVRSFNDPSVGAVAGHIEHSIKADSADEETLYRTFETWQKRMESALHSTISAFGGFYAVRRELFCEIPANSYSNDDVLIPMNVIRQGYRVIFDPEAVSEEDVSGKINMEFKRRIRIGAGNFQAFFRLLDFLNPLKGWPAFCYVSHKVTRWFSPLFFIAALASAGVLTVYSHGPAAVLFLAGSLLIALGISAGLFRIKILRPLYYFLLMNAALLLGLLRYLGGIRSAAWSRTERS